MAHFLCLSTLNIIASTDSHTSRRSVHLSRTSLRPRLVQYHCRTPSRHHRSGFVWRAESSNHNTNISHQQMGSGHQQLFAGKDIIRLHDLSHNSRNITLCGEFLHQPNLPLVEQLVILALLGFCYSNDYTRAMYWLTNAYLQVRCSFLNSVTVDVTDKNEDFITWIGTVLAATSDPGSQPWTLGLSLLEARPTARDWQANVKLCETFFWNESMSLRLSSKIGYLRQKSRQGQG